jgi:hypothetical protein
MRGHLQRLQEHTPVVILGSKKHLLSRIFADHRAPLAGWGRDILIPEVSTQRYVDEYYQFVEAYFHQVDKSLAKDAFEYLLEKVQGIPESINIVCNFILRSAWSHIGLAEVMIALRGSVEERRSRYEEMVSRLKLNERNVLTALAKNQPVKQPKSKEFLNTVGTVAPTSVFNAIKNLEDQAEIYRTEDGYVIADPLLGVYLRLTR